MSQNHRSSNGQNVEGGNQAALLPNMKLCTVCNEPIPERRLKLVPFATTCVPCLEAAGDVPRIHRHDEYIGGENEIDVVSIHYKKLSPYVRRVQKRNNNLIGKILAQNTLDNWYN